MRADLVDETRLLASLEALSKRLRKQPGSAKRNVSQNRRGRKPDGGSYRAGVGIMLLNNRGEIFVGRRADVGDNAWQMPQGGIDPGETPHSAVFREMKEEIGTDNAEIIAETSDWLYYDVPAQMAKKAWGGRWIGQKQKWFVMLFKGENSEIDLSGPNPEFDTWRWVPLQELPRLAVAFKRQLYLSLLGKFSTVFRD
jgi:putative (di)nucleoside polyphosphate hydrolase